MLHRPFFQMEQVLPPVDVAVEEMLGSVARTAYQFVEIGQAVGIVVKAAAESPSQASYPKDGE